MKPYWFKSLSPQWRARLMRVGFNLHPAFRATGGRVVLVSSDFHHIRIKLPLLKPAIVVALLFRAILAFKAFDEVYLLTGGGPGTSSELVSLHLYRVFFEQNQLGYGALLSVLTIVVVLSLLGAGRRFLVAGTP